MNEVVDKLVKDLAWRIRRGGAKYKPGDKEVASWAPFTIHGSVPFLISLPLLGLLTMAMGGGGGDLLPTIWLFSIPALYWCRGVINFRSKLGAYKKLLIQNERFMLVEYSKYLRRQIARTREEPALGGEAEIRRLKELLDQLNQLLQQGAGKSAGPLRSNLADEAVLAEAMIETYSAGQKNELAELDARLPADLRQRIADLDNASSASANPPTKVAQ